MISADTVKNHIQISASCRGFSESQGPQEGGRPECWPRACWVELPGQDRGPGPRPGPPAEQRRGRGQGQSRGPPESLGVLGSVPAPQMTVGPA